MPEPTSGEVVLCDSSFVSAQERASRDPVAVAHWPRDTVARLNAGVLAEGEVVNYYSSVYSGWTEHVYLTTPVVAEYAFV